MKDDKGPKLNVERIAKINPDLARRISEIQAKQAAGLIEYEYPKRTYRECRSWREAWIYIFGRAFLDHGNHLKSEGGKVTRVVWPVREFDDKWSPFWKKLPAESGRTMTSPKCD